MGTPQPHLLPSVRAGELPTHLAAAAKSSPMAHIYCTGIQSSRPSFRPTITATMRPVPLLPSRTPSALPNLCPLRKLPGRLSTPGSTLQTFPMLLSQSKRYRASQRIWLSEASTQTPADSLPGYIPLHMYTLVDTTSREHSS